MKKLELMMQTNVFFLCIAAALYMSMTDLPSVRLSTTNNEMTCFHVNLILRRYFQLLFYHISGKKWKTYQRVLELQRSS